MYTMESFWSYFCACVLGSIGIPESHFFLHPKKLSRALKRANDRVDFYHHTLLDEGGESSSVAFYLCSSFEKEEPVVAHWIN